ncbi:heme transporter hrg1-B-like [Anneissia japonica]|uniref:heme transporter hrg1-B-like n=1 Tax=Anneissia japonica TaxID=1529436 RepID=UPI0014258D09|nr:heme transporter hrg1-B-like [Anneissia japonica]XP_033105827.1 heme transporter hrg1-B-like [Anneissia japonica]
MEETGTVQPRGRIRRVTYSITGMVLGLSILIVFLVVEKFRNYHVAVWGAVSALFAAVSLVLHLQHNNDTSKERWIRRLSLIMLIGFVTQMCCIVAFFTYIIMAAEQKQAVIPVNCRHCGYYLAAVWVFMTWKWSFLTFFYARMYRKIYLGHYAEVVESA